MTASMDAKFWLDLAQWSTTIALAIYIYFSNRRKATTDSIVALDKVVSEQQLSNEKRLSHVESEISHLPTHNDLKNINNTLSSMEGSLKGLTRAVDIMNEYLLNRKEH